MKQLQSYDHGQGSDENNEEIKNNSHCIVLITIVSDNNVSAQEQPERVVTALQLGGLKVTPTNNRNDILSPFHHVIRRIPFIDGGYKNCHEGCKSCLL